RTGNPLYVWDALAAIAIKQAIAWLTMSISTSPDQSKKRAAFDRLSIGPLPGWIIRYFLQATSDLPALRRGFRPGAATHKHILGKDAREPPRLKADAAARLMLKSLGLIRPGWNAFDAYWSEEHSAAL